MPRIIPLRELNNPSKISQMCHESDAPIFITKSGESDMVIMSSEAYDNMNQPIKYDYTEQEKIKVAEPATLKEYIAIRDSKPLYSVSEIKETLHPIFEKFKVKKAILFGSYVKGTADHRSDVDILVDSRLNGLSFYGLLGAVADALRFPVDLIDTSQLEKGSDMEKEILKTGVTIYG